MSAKFHLPFHLSRLINELLQFAVEDSFIHSFWRLIWRLFKRLLLRGTPSPVTDKEGELQRDVKFVRVCKNLSLSLYISLSFSAFVYLCESSVGYSACLLMPAGLT